MGKKKVDPERKRRAVVEVIRDKKPLREAARELGVAPSTLHEAVVETKERTAAALPLPTTATTEIAPAAAAAGDQATPKPDAAAKVDRILAHAGAVTTPGGSAVTAPLTAKELAPVPRVDKAEYCVQKCATFKGMAVFGISQNYKVPASDPMVKQLAPLSLGLELEIRAQADFLFPYLEKWGGPGMLAAMAIYELWQVMGMLKEHGVKHYGYVQPDPKTGKIPGQAEADKARQAAEAALAEKRRLEAEIAAAKAAAAAAPAPTEEEPDDDAPLKPGEELVVKPDPFNCPNK